jgi:transcription initiation factor IIE alpha subunit
MRGGKKKVRNAYEAEVDTNIYQISLECLKNDADMATGDAEICPKCHAVFNKHSKVIEVKDLSGET